MTKADLVAQIAKRTGLDRDEVLLLWMLSRMRWLRATISTSEGLGVLLLERELKR